jgi:hypothetical protein
MPTAKAATDWNLNSVRLKNLIQKTEHDLKQLNCDTDLLNKLTGPLWDLQGNTKFLQEMRKGAAFFSGPDFFRYLIVPLELEEQTVVSDLFHIKPLLFLENRNKPYYLLSLSKHEISLYKADRFSLEKISLPGAPENIEDFSGTDEVHREKRSSVYHSQGAGTDKSQEKEKTRRYIHSLEKAVTKLLNGRTEPLILFSVEYLQGIYRKENSYGNLVHEGIHGNPEHVSDEQLIKAGWEVAGPVLSKELMEAVGAFENAQEHHKVSGKIDTILKAAFEGRIHTLFLSPDNVLWGDFNRDTERIIHYTEAKPGAHDLPDLAAHLTLETGGNVYLLEQEEMPGREKIAALYRYQRGK